MKWWEEKEKGSEGKGKEWEMKWNQPVRDRPLSEIPKAKCAHVYAVFYLSLRISHTPPLYTVLATSIIWRTSTQTQSAPITI